MKLKNYKKSEIAKWCGMPLGEHLDGVGGCCGISGGGVAEFGEKYCKTCEYYKKKSKIKDKK